MHEPDHTSRISLPGGCVLEETALVHVQALEELQKRVFPTLAVNELIRAEHYRRHLEVFPEGQFVIVCDNRPVAMTTTMRTFFDFSHPYHTFNETIAGGWLSNHDPNGDWLYGLDMGVDPDWRGRGLSKALYQARHDLARRLGLRGQLTVGMMNGYGPLRAHMSAEAYYKEWLDGRRADPTLSAQRAAGFEPLMLMAGYLHDPQCDGYGVLMKKEGLGDKWIIDNSKNSGIWQQESTTDKGS